MNNMKAVPIKQERIPVGDGGFAEITIWAVPAPVPPSTHGYKYRLAYVVGDVCRVRYDNERGKGDHKHLRGREVPYAFTTLERLVDDFWADVARL